MLSQLTARRLVIAAYALVSLAIICGWAVVLRAPEGAEAA